MRIARLVLLAFLALGLAACGAPRGPQLVDWGDGRGADVVIRGARILDVEAGTVGRPSDVHVRENPPRGASRAEGPVRGVSTM